jgi:hypothetical protein
MIFHQSRQRQKKVIGLKILCVAGARNQSGEYLFIWNFEKLEVKNLQREALRSLIN